MTHVELRHRPEQKDVDELVRSMRAEDQAECIACGYAPAEGLAMAIRESAGHVFALVIDYQVVAIYGVVPVRDGVGSVWALTSAAVNRHRKTFWKTSRAVLELLTNDWPFLFAAVDARYTAAVRWLKRLGFILGEPFLMPGSAVPFHHASYRRT